MRLIDVDNLIKLTQKDMEFAFNNGFLDMAFEREHLIKVIKNQPTAYDIDKVVEKLERYPLGNLGCQELNEIIEIVKQGGVSDDVCEWRLCDEEVNAYDTSCRNPHILIEGTPRENNYEFCPYCGKKIKIVGD